MTTMKEGRFIEIAPSAIELSRTYSADVVDKLLVGIHMLGGSVCPTCGTVHIRGVKCPICTYKKYL